jgi:hypothetical protein
VTRLAAEESLPSINADNVMSYRPVAAERLLGKATLIRKGAIMSRAKQKTAARRNVKKAAAAAKSKKTIRHLSKATRTALGKQGAKVAKERGAHG